MITISEKTPPKSSYKKILENPVTEKIFIKTLSQLWIEGNTREAIINEFKKVLSEFTDPTYTGDIKHFKTNLYTTLTEADKEINLVDVLSTEEFVARSTEMIQNLIYIKTLDNNRLTLEEYIKYYSQIRPERHHILPVLRWLYRCEPNNKVYRDTSEIVAALKKHIVTNTENSSTTELSSVVEKSKQNEVILREDEGHYNNIKSYTDNLPKDSAEYSYMISKIKTALEYFSDSNGYKKEKLDKLMSNFLRKIANKWISLYEKEHFWSPLSDLFKVEFSQKIDTTELIDLVKNNNEYKELLKKLLEDRKENLLGTIQMFKERIEKFSRPTREERVNRAPYRWAPIKSDQEYSGELENLRDTLDMDEKNLELIESYLLKLNSN